eukprot:SAG31_NODE_3735_length_3938_cov_1.264913_4_plen_204_part_00
MVARSLLRLLHKQNAGHQIMESLLDSTVGEFDTSPQSKTSCVLSSRCSALLLFVSILLMAAGQHICQSGHTFLSCSNSAPYGNGLRLLGLAILFIAAATSIWQLLRSDRPLAWLKAIAYCDEQADASRASVSRASRRSSTIAPKDGEEVAKIHGGHKFKPMKKLVRQLRDKGEYVTMVYLMVAYIFLVSTALEPWVSVKRLLT